MVKRLNQGRADISKGYNIKNKVLVMLQGNHQEKKVEGTVCEVKSQEKVSP